jgi:predicted Zn-dependent protease
MSKEPIETAAIQKQTHRGSGELGNTRALWMRAKRGCFLCLLLFGPFICLAPLRAETVSYPDKDPVFSVEVPDGWHVKHDKGAVMLVPRADAAVLLQHVSDVKDADAAKTGLPSLAKSAAKTFSMNDTAVVTAPNSIKLGEFQGFAAEYKGKDKDGEDAFWQVIIFSRDNDDYYLMTVVCSDKDDKKTAADRDTIVNSVKATSDDE